MQRERSLMETRFQSTCLREARLNPRIAKIGSGGHFNPRAYVRHDFVLGVDGSRDGISIHVPT